MTTIELTEKIVAFDGDNQSHDIKSIGSLEFAHCDLNSLIDLVTRQYHSNTRKDVVTIYELAQKVFLRHGDKNPELAMLTETLFLFFDDLLFHLKTEEQILFPSIIHLNEKKVHEGSFNYSTFGLIKEYSSTMQVEHRDVIKQFQFLRRLTNDYKVPEHGSMLYQSLFSKMRTFEKEMLRHIQLENDFLFPRAIRMDEN